MPLVSPQKSTEMCTAALQLQRESCSPTSRAVHHSQCFKGDGEGREVIRLGMPRGKGMGISGAVLISNSSSLPTTGLSPSQFYFHSAHGDVPSLPDKVLAPFLCSRGPAASHSTDTSWHSMNNPWCITALGSALHSSVGFQHTAIKKAERVALGCLKHPICASPSSLDRHS